MFDYKHYIPVLRWKSAEWSALAELKNEQKNIITPLIEPTPNRFDKDKDIDKIVTRTLKKIEDAWDSRHLFIDFHLLTETMSSAILNKFVSSKILHFIPVVSLNSQNSYLKLMKPIVKNQHRVCIRIFRSNITDSNLALKLDNVLQFFKLKPSNVDLIVDYQLIDESCPGLCEICKTIPYLLEWNSFTFLSGTFTRDLTGFKPGVHLHPRVEWRKWYEEIGLKGLARRPSYGDYTIQHPIYYEPPSFPSISASIRYTTDRDWVIMRGESVKKDGGPGYGQYLGNALLLSKRDEFCGNNFSAGDKYIYEKGQQLEGFGNLEKTGNATTWLQAGVNHHIAFVVHQLSNLPDS